MVYVLVVFLWIGDSANIQFQEFSSYEQCVLMREHIKNNYIKHRSNVSDAQCFKK